MKIAAFPNFARYESSFAILSDELNKNNVDLFTIDEERLLRIKHTYNFPLLAMEYCLKQAKLKNINEVDYIITDYARRKSLFNDGPGYNKLENDYLKSIIDFPRDKIIIANHHDAHAAGVFYPSGFEESAILVVDGMGSNLETQSIYYANNKDGISCIDKGFGWGIGSLYSEISILLGFVGLNGVDLSGKTMGLAPLGRNLKLKANNFKGVYKGASLDYSEIISRYPKPKILNKYLKQRKSNQNITKDYWTKIAFDLQKEAERAMIHLANTAHKFTGSKNLCITGGVGLNSVANGKIKKNSPYENIFVLPFCSDTGIAHSLATYGYYKLNNHTKNKKMYLKNAFFGKIYKNNSIKNILRQNKVPYYKFDSKKIARLISKKKIIGWFIKGSELGPRALGHRSILVDPRDYKMKDILNARVKHRENFRPFAPAVLEEKLSEFFPIKHKTPFMVEVYDFIEKMKNKVKAVVHYDGSGRLQTVSEDECPVYYQLIKDFYEITNVPILLNTSFNDKEPIVETPDDALITFLSTDIDILVIDNITLFKKDFKKDIIKKIVTKLKLKRKNSIERKIKNIKRTNFSNYSEKVSIEFQNKENIQANWHLKYSAKYELEKFIEKETMINSKILLFGTQSHTKFLYEKIYDFPNLNIVGFVEYNAKKSNNILKNKFKIIKTHRINKIKWDKILITSHEYLFSIRSILIDLGIKESKIIQIYDEASDSLERHINYLPQYNKI